jgi:hypothetical protein
LSAVPQAAVGTVAARKWVTDFVLLSAIWGSPSCSCGWLKKQLRQPR